MRKTSKITRPLVWLMMLALTLLAQPILAQDILDKTFSAEFRQQRLGEVLEILSHQGNFYFSYNSSILKADSLVDLSAKDRTLRQILDMLFHGTVGYKVNRNYIIILRRAPPDPPRRPVPRPERKKTISGTIQDVETGEGLSQASVYDRQALVATLTDQNGFFTLRLKHRSGPTALTVSKEFYEDTTIFVTPDNAGQITIAVSPSELSRRMVTVAPGDYLLPDSLKQNRQADPAMKLLPHGDRDFIQLEINPFTRVLLSSRLKIQSLNLKKFFVQRPYQVSILPGLGTNGFLSPQIENKLSINLFAGYTAGLDGVELGAFLNIDKRQVRGLQLAGFCNAVGGSVTGLQMAGFHNTVLDSVHGWQLAGFSNFSKKNFSGVQASGFANVNCKETRGVQISGFLNYSRMLKGVQIGVINICDTSEGYSIGLINIVRKGHYSFSFFANEAGPLNFAFRSGNRKLYSILVFGLNPSDNNTSYYYGFGLGHQFRLNHDLFLDPEITSARVAPGAWSNFKYLNLLNKLSFNVQWRLGKICSLSAGPSLAIYYADHDYTHLGQLLHLPHDGYPGFSFSANTRGWIGWQAEINFL